MRTTLDLDDRLLKSAKKLAAEEGKTLTAVVEEALQLRLEPPRKAGKPFKLNLLVLPGDIAPGVDFADRNTLYDILDGVE